MKSFIIFFFKKKKGFRDKKLDFQKVTIKKSLNIFRLNFLCFLSNNKLIRVYIWFICLIIFWASISYEWLQTIKAHFLCIFFYSILSIYFNVLPFWLDKIFSKTEDCLKLNFFIFKMYVYLKYVMQNVMNVMKLIYCKIIFIIYIYLHVKLL